LPTLSKADALRARRHVLAAEGRVGMVP
jgi:hypothetical protein